MKIYSIFGGLGLLNVGTFIVLPFVLYNVLYKKRRLTEFSYVAVMLFSANVACLFAWMTGVHSLDGAPFGLLLYLSLPGIIWMLAIDVAVAKFRPTEIESIRSVLQKTKREKLEQCARALFASVILMSGIWLLYSFTQFRLPVSCGIFCNSAMMLLGDPTTVFVVLNTISLVGGAGIALFLFCILSVFFVLDISSEATSGSTASQHRKR